jgi:hypothetical protein
MTPVSQSCFMILSTSSCQYLATTSLHYYYYYYIINISPKLRNYRTAITHHQYLAVEISPLIISSSYRHNLRISSLSHCSLRDARSPRHPTVTAVRHHYFTRIPSVFHLHFASNLPAQTGSPRAYGLAPQFTGLAPRALAWRFTTLRRHGGRQRNGEQVSGGTTCAMVLVQWALLHEMTRRKT